jgi:peroxiredoxin
MAKLAKGDLFPDFKFQTHTGEESSISKIVDGKPTMILVLRYIGCTVCVYDTSMIQKHYEDFKAKGVNVAVLMQSTPENAREYLDSHNLKLSFPIICNPDQSIYKELEILPATSKEQLVGQDMAKLQIKGGKAKRRGFEHGKYEGNERQLPAFFYLDGDRKVKEAHYAKTIVDIPTVEEMLAKI